MSSRRFVFGLCALVNLIGAYNSGGFTEHDAAFIVGGGTFLCLHWVLSKLRGEVLDND